MPYAIDTVITTIIVRLVHVSLTLETLIILTIHIKTAVLNKYFELLITFDNIIDLFLK